MDFFIYIFGEGDDLSFLQMAARTIIIFFIALILVRIAGRRTFALHMTFDNVLTVLLGAILGRVIVGASPFLPTIGACLIMAGMHRLLALVSIHYRKFEDITKGVKIPLYRDGKLLTENLARSQVSKEDIFEAARIVLNSDSIENVKQINLERNGKISFVLK